MRHRLSQALIGLVLLSFTSPTTAQSLWSLQKHQQGKSAFGFHLGMLNAYTELTAGIEHGIAKNHKLTISGGLGFLNLKELNVPLPPDTIAQLDLPPIVVGKTELMRFTPLNSKRLTLFSVGNLQYATTIVKEIQTHTYGLQGALGVMNRFQAGTETTVTPLPGYRLAASGSLVVMYPSFGIMD